MELISALVLAALLSGAAHESRPPLFRGIYLNSYAAGNRKYMRGILKHLGEEVNAVVIDMKLDSGIIPYRSQVPMARRVGAIKPIIRHIDEIMSKLKERGVYTIARVIVFKDKKLADYRGGKYAIRDERGGIWVDRNGETWVDPFCQEIWDYNLDIARELALLGFDEIQFDYLRFPTEGDVSNCVHPYQGREEKREEAILGFLKTARRTLAPLGARIGVDVFGFTVWLESIPVQGQDIDLIGRYADTVYPMLYPSHFGAFMRNLSPREREYKLIFESTRRAKERLSGTGADLVVYLQGFNWAAPEFGTEYIRNQIEAALKGGSSGWIIWHSASDYRATWHALKDPLPILRRRSPDLRLGELDPLLSDPPDLTN